MKSKLGIFFIASSILALLVGVDFLGTHLLLTQEHLGRVDQDVYRTLIAKWFLTGVLFGAAIMFLLVEAWVWKNWRSWNKFCCDHHEKVYKATMGISQGKMLRR